MLDSVIDLESASRAQTSRRRHKATLSDTELNDPREASHVASGHNAAYLDYPPGLPLPLPVALQRRQAQASAVAELLATQPPSLEFRRRLRGLGTTPAPPPRNLLLFVHPFTQQCSAPREQTGYPDAHVGCINDPARAWMPKLKSRV